MDEVETERQRAGVLLQQRWQEFGLEKLLTEEQDYLLLWELNAEVSAGTLDAYLTSEAGDHALQAIAALERQSAEQMGSILRKTVELLPGGWSADADERRRRLAALPDRWARFRELTDAYYEALPEAEAAGECAIERIQSAYRREGWLPPAV